tara:strand:+ start:72 stop:263 length:192 start_codon:yes stop_codon:yes gene_type:complete
MNTEPPMYNCTSCRHVWQVTTKLVNPYSNEKSKVNYYKDFPTYGKEKKTCEKCKESEVENNYG